jgi:cytochrome c553
MQFLLGLLTTLIVLSASAEELPSLAYLCVKCHGERGANPWPDVPNIGGLSEVLIYNALWDYREKARPCREPACTDTGQCPDLDMCQVAEKLTDEQLDLLARTFSSFPFQGVESEFDTRLAAQGREIHYRQCNMCHADGATHSREGAAILRGQKPDYLRQSLEDFQHGRRPVLRTMLSRVQALGQDQLKTLVHFYASPPEGLRRSRR